MATGTRAHNQRHWPHLESDEGLRRLPVPALGATLDHWTGRIVPALRRGGSLSAGAEALARILASDTNLGCRHLIERQPELVHGYETTNVRFVTDLDTVDDVQQLAKRTGWRLELPVLETTP